MADQDENTVTKTSYIEKRKQLVESIARGFSTAAKSDIPILTIAVIPVLLVAIGLAQTAFLASFIPGVPDLLMKITNSAADTLEKRPSPNLKTDRLTPQT